MVTKTRSVDGVDADSVSVPDINMASAYYACVFDAEVIRDRTPCAMRVDRRTYSLAAKTPCPAETHSITVADVDLAVARAAYVVVSVGVVDLVVAGAAVSLVGSLFAFM